MPFFETDFARLHYYQYGQGSKVLIAFHGFGMRGTQFSVLQDAFGEKYTLYSFDLFFHGETHLKDNSVETIKKGLNAKEISLIIQAFLTSIGKENQKISLLSYSIGAKLALAILQEMPQNIQSAYFIAADGIESNFLLNIFSSQHINNWLHGLVYKPKTVMFLLNSLYKYHYIDDALHRILTFEFSTEEYRMISYKTITYYSRLKFDRKYLAQLINENEIETHLFFGKKDKLFPAGIASRFGQLLKHPHVHIFNEGHELITERLNAYIKNLI